MKNIYNIVRKGTLAMLALVLLGSCTESETIYQYLKVSDKMVSFSSSDNSEFRIDVEASGEWIYTIDGDWIEDIASDINGITITVSDNATSNVRYGTITFICNDIETKTSVLQANVGSNAEVVLGNVFNGGVVSPSGTYVAGRVVIAEGDDLEQICPVLIDAKTGEVTVQGLMTKETTIGAVDNFGNIFTSSGMVKMDGEVVSYDLPNEVSWANVSGTSADGRVWVGSCFPKDKAMWEAAGFNYPGAFGAIKWVDGVPEILEVPATNATGAEALWYGLDALGCSDDGSVIYGRIYDYMEACYWDKNGKFNLIAPELNEFDSVEYYGKVYYTMISGTQQYYELEKISPNGKYLAFHYDGASGMSPAYLDTETGEYKILSDYGGLATNTMDNEGNMFVCPSNNYGPATVISLDGSVTDGNQWIKENYGLIISDARAIGQVAADGSLFGYKSLDSQYYLAWWLLK